MACPCHSRPSSQVPETDRERISQPLLLDRYDAWIRESGVLDSVAVVGGCSCFFLSFACLSQTHKCPSHSCYISLLFDVAVFWLLFIICANKLATFTTAFLHYDGVTKELYNVII